MDLFSIFIRTYFLICMIFVKTYGLYLPIHPESGVLII
ncbi:hypothetical protein LEP1GSC170_1092 [Leptospira interrogans serovar Bataviae str. HAI135]|nr:hypothetical protein LEP1GSC170_1092 [Leptospira interrogans serovar Bataviae str. HAI135]